MALPSGFNSWLQQYQQTMQARRVALANSPEGKWLASKGINQYGQPVSGSYWSNLSQQGSATPANSQPATQTPSSAGAPKPPAGGPMNNGVITSQPDAGAGPANSPPVNVPTVGSTGTGQGWGQQGNATGGMPTPSNPSPHTGYTSFGQNGPAGGGSFWNTGGAAFGGSKNAGSAAIPGTNAPAASAPPPGGSSYGSPTGAISQEPKGAFTGTMGTPGVAPGPGPEGTPTSGGGSGSNYGTTALGPVLGRSNTPSGGGGTATATGLADNFLGGGGGGVLSGVTPEPAFGSKVGGFGGFSGSGGVGSDTGTLTGTSGFSSAGMGFSEGLPGVSSPQMRDGGPVDNKAYDVGGVINPQSASAQSQQPSPSMAHDAGGSTSPGAGGYGYSGGLVNIQAMIGQALNTGQQQMLGGGYTAEAAPAAPKAPTLSPQQASTVDPSDSQANSGEKTAQAQDTSQANSGTGPAASAVGPLNSVVSSPVGINPVQVNAQRRGGPVGYDDGGGVVPGGQQGQPMQPGQQQGQMGPNSKLAGYALGQGAAPAQQVRQMEQMIDPKGQMDPTERTMRTVAGAGSPEAAFGVLQHYRQQFNSAKALAQIAATGTPQKPADPVQAAKAATMAFNNVPDGRSMQFTPNQDGTITVAVKDLVNQGKANSLPPPTQGMKYQGPKRFDDGGAPAPPPSPNQSPSQGNEFSGSEQAPPWHMMEQMAPHGVDTRGMRPSQNVEDNRDGQHTPGVARQLWDKVGPNAWPRVKATIQQAVNPLKVGPNGQAPELDQATQGFDTGGGVIANTPQESAPTPPPQRMAGEVIPIRPDASQTYLQNAVQSNDAAKARVRQGQSPYASPGNHKVLNMFGDTIEQHAQGGVIG